MEAPDYDKIGRFRARIGASCAFMTSKLLAFALSAALTLTVSTPAAARDQAPANPPAQQAAQTPQPPDGSGPVFTTITLQFHPVNESIIEPQTYLYYIQAKDFLSRPSAGVWQPFNEQTEQVLREDFKRLWATNFLDNLWIEVTDRPYPNGVIAKNVTIHMEERPRIKIVDYVGSDKIERTKVDEKMKEANVSLRLDSFLDQGAVRRVEGILRGLMAEKGYQFAEVRSSVEPLPGGPKLVKVVFNVNEGPKVRIRNIDFIGNRAFSDGKLRSKMKDTKTQWMFSWLTGRGTYQEAKFEEDAERVETFYREQGYIQARVGQPEIRTLEDSRDKETRWVELRIPVTEGERYRIGEINFDGNTVVKTDFLRTLVKAKPGDWYSEKRIRDFFEKAREVYGAGGYMEFTGYPDYEFIDAAEGPVAGPGQSTVNVTLRLQEGEQYFVNRLTFTGNTTTRDNVIRREMRLLEGHIFNTESLKYSIRRLNQLGYFQNLEQSPDAVDVQKTPGEKNQVDVTLRLQEQNRNQLTFGAGVSQFEGFFGQLSFQTSNFLGRGESLTLSLQAGSRAENYQLAFTEPFLFDRNITGGIDVYKRTLQYIGQFTQKAAGGNIMFGFPVSDFGRLFTTYSYESVKVTDLNPAYRDPRLVANNPFLQESLLLNQQGGSRTVSKIRPAYVFNTIDNPIFPTTGRRLTLSTDVAGLGGNTNFLKPSIEGIAIFRHTARTSIAFRGQAEYIRPYGGTTVLPLFERLFLGGEYSVRGFDIRTIGPRDPLTGVVLGGNKSLLFNAEYLITIAQPVRLVLFFDAGQVRDIGENFSWYEDVVEIVNPPPPTISDPFYNGLTLTECIAPGDCPVPPGPETRVVGRTSAFKTSTGAEVRFFMPVLNVPFRLIFAMNPHRGNVLDNNYRPAQRFTFRFAVGSTF
jgi:outer membrane protein insertion porin family